MLIKNRNSHLYGSVHTHRGHRNMRMRTSSPVPAYFLFFMSCASLIGTVSYFLDLKFICSSYSNCCSEGWITVPILTPQKKKKKRKLLQTVFHLKCLCNSTRVWFWHGGSLILRSPEEKKNNLENNSNKRNLKIETVLPEQKKI